MTEGQILRVVEYDIYFFFLVDIEISSHVKGIDSRAFQTYFYLILIFN